MSRLQSAAGRVPGGWSFAQWPLRRKLAAALVLPMLLAFFFGALRVQNDFRSAQELFAAADTVKVIRPVVDYNLAVQRLAAAESIGGGGVISAITKYESAAADLRIAVKQSGVPESVKSSAESALALGQAVRVAKTQNGFSSVVIDKSGSTAALMSAAVADLGLTDDSASAKQVVALQDAIAAQRAMTGEQLNLANVDDGSATLRAIGQAGAETAALTRLQTAGTISGGVRDLLNANARRAFTLTSSPSKAEIEGLATSFEASNSAYSQLMDGQLNVLETNLRTRAAEHRNGALLTAGLIAAALLAALVLVFALLRSLLGPIRVLREGALEVAQKRLPEAVARIRDGEEAPPFEPIAVTTREEMGQLARAVDDLHSQALTLAGEQARLRVQVSHMFETLSRRSTSLVDQQLSLIERLESDEEDPKRLQSLFRLDHLAARMRRNSDSLLVLAGTSTRRGVSGSVSVADAVRAAVSEVENYERIDIGETSRDHVLGAVGSDLIHLLAEVVDNALAYSPPTSRVAIRGARTPEGGLLIEVTDRGLGMPPKDLAALNDQLAHGGDITADTARRMGLYVVGSLAKRHGIAVRLRRNGDDKQGVTVSVHLPAGLLADTAVQRPERPTRGQGTVPGASPQADAPAAPPVSAVGGTTKSGLPARVRAASGATPTPIPGAAKKVLPTRTPGAQGPGATGSTALPAKPVIETTHGPAGAAETAAPVNGAAAAHPPVNGDQAADDPRVNGTPTPDESLSAATDKSPVNGTSAPEAKPTHDEAAAVDQAIVAEPDEATDAPTADVGATETVTSSPEQPAAPAVSTAGLPVRKPSASRITEYREFEDAPSAEEPTKPESRQTSSEAPTPKTGRLTGWLPGRKAAAQAAARAEAEASEPRQMPSNLSAWLDHRAKMVEASLERQLGGTQPSGPHESIEQVASASATEEISVEDAPTPQEPQTGEDLHVPQEWVAEVTGQQDVKADEPDLTSDEPDLTSDEPDLTSDEPDGPAAGEHPAYAQGESPIGAPAQEAPAEQTREAMSEAAPTAAPAAHAPESITALPTRVPGTSGAPTAEVATPSLNRPALRAHNSSFFGARKARETQHAAPAVEPAVEAAPVAEADRPVESKVAEEIETQVVAQVQSLDNEPDNAPDTAPELEPGHASDVEPEAATDVDPAGDAPTTLNDTPIFRAMMSRWLTDDAQPGESGEWSPTEADEAWSAAARIEEAPPLEESAAGLPKRRPGNHLIPGAIDSTTEVPAPALPAVNRRDPEAIRRNLSRHQRGVSSARTETQDGTHREEADVHH